MHHIFELDEILRLITGHLIESGGEGALSLACCCKHFSIPVLDTMWEEGQTDLVTLLQTFPPSVWEVDRRTFNFVRQPSDEEWRRFYIYAQRMRRLDMPCRRAVFPSNIALVLLNAHFSCRCMLPNLRKLNWDKKHTGGEIALVLPLLVSPVLTSFDLDLEGGSRTKAVVSSLAPAFGSLRSIYITGSYCDLVQDSSTLLLNCNPNQLRRFDTGSPVSWAAFLHASQLPNLEFFVIQVGGTGKPNGASLPTTMFPSLKHLRIEGIDADSIWLQSLGRIRSKSLKLLGLDLNNPAAARTVLPTVVRYLRFSGLDQTLRKLIIHPKCDLFVLDVDGMIVENLLPLSQLTTLHLSFVCSPDMCGYKLSDEDLEKLVKAMPNLKSLALGMRPCSRPADNSIKSLAAIAKHCKHLKKLVIHTNVEAVISDPNYHPGEDHILGEPALVECPLLSITLGPYSRLREQPVAEKFASALLRLFPHLANVETTGAGLGGSLVTQCIAAFRHTRS